MSELNRESAATPPPSSPEEPIGQEEQSKTTKVKTVQTLWARFVWQLKARLYPDNHVYLEEAIEDVRQAVRMLENLSAVIKAELTFIKIEPPQTNELPMSQSHELAVLVKRLDAMRLEAWSHQVQAAVHSARVALKIAETARYQNLTYPTYNWGTDDLEIHGEFNQLRQSLPKKSHLHFIDTDRAYEELTNGRLKGKPRRGSLTRGCGRR